MKTLVGASDPDPTWPLRIWTTSSACDTNTCVGVTFVGDQVLVANTRNVGHTVAFTAAEWTVFLHGAREGEFDVPE